MARPSLLGEELRRTWRELRGADLSPARGALAVGLGLFIGSLPPGCHTPVVLAICIWLQLDAAIAWVASNISNPLFAPVLYTVEVQLGAYVRTGEIIFFDYETAQETGFTGFVGYWLIGAPLVGLGLALAGGALIYTGMTVKRRFRPAGPRAPYVLPADAPPWWQATERVAGRYAPPEERSSPAQRTRFHYVRVKLLTDPVTKMIADLCGEAEAVLGEVLDLGTGRGQLPIVLLELGRATRARGIDWDEAKIADARQAAGPRAEREALPAEFAVGDLTEEATFEPADTVLLIDVIHYLTSEQQDDLLRRAAAAVKPGGRLIIREADTARGWRSWATLLEEKVFTALRFNRGARVKFRASGEIVAVLEGAGLACEVKPAWGGTPFSNVLIRGTRAA